MPSSRTAPVPAGGQVPHALIATEMHVKLTPSAARFNLHSTPAAEKVLRVCNACQWRSDASPVSNGIFFCLFAGWVTADGLDRHVDTAPACITRLHHQSAPSLYLSLASRSQLCVHFVAEVASCQMCHDRQCAVIVFDVCVVVCVRVCVCGWPAKVLRALRTSNSCCSMLMWHIPHVPGGRSQL